jgi:hypothetical protein
MAFSALCGLRKGPFLDCAATFDRLRHFFVIQSQKSEARTFQFLSWGGLLVLFDLSLFDSTFFDSSLFDSNLCSNLSLFDLSLFDYVEFNQFYFVQFDFVQFSFVQFEFVRFKFVRFEFVRPSISFKYIYLLMQKILLFISFSVFFEHSNFLQSRTNIATQNSAQCIRLHRFKLYPKRLYPSFSPDEYTLPRIGVTALAKGF